MSEKRMQGRACGVSLVAACAAAAMMLLPPAAAATYDPVGQGATTLSLSGPFAALLHREGVSLRATQGAELHGRAVRFPTAAGRIEPPSGLGTVKHAGALALIQGHRKVLLKDLILKTASRHSPLAAKAGGSQLKLASAAGLTLTRKGFGVKAKTAALELSAKLATRLNRKLGLKGVFKAGQALGTSLTVVDPETVALRQRAKASFTPDPATVAKLNELFVALNPIFPAEHTGPSFSFPIFGGQLAPKASSGTLETSGALELIQLFGGQVFLHAPWAELDPGAFSAELEVEPSPPYAGKQGRLAIATLSLAGAAVSFDPKARTISVAGATEAMGAGFAATLNEVFAHPKGKGDVFKPGDPLGTISFTAQGQ